MPDEKAGREPHDETVIREYVEWDYPALKGNVRELSVGLGGNGIYRVAIMDRENVLHTLKIEPRHVDGYLATKDRVERLAAESPLPLEPVGRDRSHDQEPR